MSNLNNRQIEKLLGRIKRLNRFNTSVGDYENERKISMFTVSGLNNNLNCFPKLVAERIFRRTESSGRRRRRRDFRSTGLFTITSVFMRLQQRIIVRGVWPGLERITTLIGHRVGCVFDWKVFNAGILHLLWPMWPLGNAFDVYKRVHCTRCKTRTR